MRAHLTTDGSGIEPTVNLGQFEELLTGKTYDDHLDDPIRPLPDLPADKP